MQYLIIYFIDIYIYIYVLAFALCKKTSYKYYHQQKKLPVIKSRPLTMSTNIDCPYDLLFF